MSLTVQAIDPVALRSPAVDCRRASLRRVLLVAVTLLVYVLVDASPAAAQGQCSYSATPSASFGTNVTSFVAQSVAQSTSAATMASCTGGLLNVLVVLGTTPYLRATIKNSAHSFQLVNAGGDAISYSAYGGANANYPLTPNVAFNFYQSTVLNVLGLLGGTGGSIPMSFVTTPPAGNLTAGTYSDTFQIDWDWKICNVGAVACLGYTSGSGTATISLSMTVTNACQIQSAPNVNFGSSPVADHFSSVSQSVGVLCTKGFVAYSIGLDPGLHVAGNGRRQMMRGTDVLQYDIYKGATTAVWGSTGTDRISNTTAANGITAQTFAYKASVYTDQTTPPVGHYTDTVVVSVSW